MPETRPLTHPDPARPGVGAPFFSFWDVGTPERQRAAVAAIEAVWTGRPWPLPGLLSYSVYAGTDGRTLLHYSQWADERAYEDFVRDQRAHRNDEVDRAVPGIERLDLVRTRYYRGFGLPGDGNGSGERPEPGCVVIVDVTFDGPDEARQRAWVDAVGEALDTDPAPPAGGISGHFHLSTDGTRVVNYAEWVSEQAHLDALAAAGEGVGSPTPQWHRVRNFPGLVRSDVRRYRLAFTAERPGSGGE
ncbi:antibiotic biosynthesis monooxygenase [Streptomyces sp. TRM 70361]|uniref:antibiotic biosynthesis monooxygenase n=1 Tax=Streptomyces sp. TRM 70361 TaxID=3116553 RepID=UPI002E7BB8D8|nr:antibiotic biosynthesis monooxygenase [Streptomyces sp. TRM 70361]MEE1941656.1 antibiotic biosynthesis monooxygenase [Streptomyces sp. TRM 70361]